jgi:hypothetical protein
MKAISDGEYGRLSSSPFGRTSVMTISLVSAALFAITSMVLRLFG